MARRGGATAEPEGVAGLSQVDGSVDFAPTRGAFDDDEGGEPVGEVAEPQRVRGGLAGGRAGRERRAPATTPLGATKGAFDPEEDGEEKEEPETPQTPSKATQAQGENKGTATGLELPEDPEELRAQYLALHEQNEAAQQDVKTWQAFQAGLTRDPVGYTVSILQRMGVSPDQIAQQLGLGGQAGSQQQQAAFDPAKWEPENEFEAALLQNYDFLSQAPGYLDQVSTVLADQGSILDDVYVENLMLTERLAALEEAMGYAPEAFDAKAFAEEVRRTNADPRAAIREKYGNKLREVYKAKSLVNKQAEVPRPETLRNGSGGGVQSRKKAKSFSDAVRLENEERGWN